jgi:hypothetical protein
MSGIPYPLVPCLPNNPNCLSSVRFNVRSRHPRLKHAFLAALVIEAVNFWIIGYPAATHSLTRADQNAAVALQWYVLHLPGIIAVDRSNYLRLHPFMSSLVLFFAGLIVTALLLLLILWLAGLARLALRKLSSPMKHPA